MARTYIRWGLSILMALLIVVTPMYYWSSTKKSQRRLRVVRDGVLYRSGQLTLEGLKDVIRDFNIRTVVTLREADEPGKPHPDAAEEKWCQDEGYNYYRLPPRAWVSNGSAIPADKISQQFVEIFKDPNKLPVLVHCFAGRHRTGAYVAIYRMEVEGWSNGKAIEEMEENGYDNLDEHQDLLGFLRQYTPENQNSPFAVNIKDGQTGHANH